MTSARILLMEDTHFSSKLVRGMLANIGYEVCAVTTSGFEAVEKTLELRPDLILMDRWLLSEATDIQAAEKIQKIVDVPILYLSAYPYNMDIISSSHDSHAFGCVHKPFNMVELCSAIEISIYRYKMEKKLKELDCSYNALAEIVPAILYRQQLVDGKMFFLNDRVMEVTGYLPSELPASKMSSIGGIVAEDDRNMVMEEVGQSIAADRPFRIEYRIIHKSGRIRHMCEHGRPIYNKSGAAIHINGMIFDITDQKQTEIELAHTHGAFEEEKSFFQSILNNLESGLLVTDADQRIVLANPYAWQYFNKTREVVVGRSLREICPEIDEQIGGGIDSGEITTHDTMQGQKVLGYSRFSLKRGDEIVGTIINFKDLSDVVAIRREMRQKERLSALGELVARVAHEMRNPLFGMTSVGQILDKELQLAPAHKQLMDCFQKEARRLNTLVEDLLECTRELRIRRESVSLRQIIEASISVNEIFIREKQIEVTADLPESGFKVWADADKLEQVLVNLLRNAVDATAPGGRIRLLVIKADNSVQIKVSDRGHGIPEEITEKIFDVFFTTKRNGTGLGLAISRNIVVAHGGLLTVCNNQNGGATFTVSLPMRDVSS